MRNFKRKRCYFSSYRKEGRIRDESCNKEHFVIGDNLEKLSGYVWQPNPWNWMCSLQIENGKIRLLFWEQAWEILASI